MAFSKTGMKIEGTSQTYGQLLVSPEKRDSVINSFAKDTVSTKPGAVAPKDTVIKVYSDGLNFVDADKLKILLAATSKQKVPTVFLQKQDQTDTQSSSTAASTTSLSKVSTDLLVVGSAIKSTEEVAQVLKESQKIDMMIALKSVESETIEVNNLQEIGLQGKFTYNFYVVDEENVTSQEDPANDPLLKRDKFNVPRYVTLTWDPITLIQKFSSDEMAVAASKAISEKAFEQSKGVVGSTLSTKKNVPIVQDGSKVQVVDLHNPEIAFASLSNKNVFANTVEVVLDTQENVNVMGELPIVVK